MKNKVIFRLVIISTMLVMAALFNTKYRNSNSFRNIASVVEELETPRHRFDLQLVKKIVFPDYDKGERMVQSPVVPRAAIERVLKNLDQEQSIPYQLEMKYGIHPFATSYYTTRKISYGNYKGTKLGVAPNCFVCHASRLESEMIVGLGNTRVDLKTFFKDLSNLLPQDYLRAIPDIARNVGPVMIPHDKSDFDDEDEQFQFFQKWIGRHKMAIDMAKFILDSKNQSDAAGHSNPWSFAVLLFNWRDKDMNYLDKKITGRKLKLDEVVLDPMPWWQLKYKTFINWDGIVRKSHRSVVQASFSPGNSGEDIRNMEPLFKEILEEAEKLEAPNYPRVNSLDMDKVSAGEHIFNRQCVKCHGIHSEDGVYRRDPIEFKKDYPEEIISWEKVQTDRQRLETINFDYLKQLEQSWLAFYGEKGHNFREGYLQNGRKGYLAPPLWGLWASAPYFHNGSVPNLQAVLFPETRPKLWRLSVPSNQFTEYDFEKTGLKIETDIEADLNDTKIYDTSKKGMSNKGHEKLFETLSTSDRLEILEYLKTL